MIVLIILAVGLSGSAAADAADNPYGDADGDGVINVQNECPNDFGDPSSDEGLGCPDNGGTADGNWIDWFFFW